jgi:carbamate kinase
VALGGNALLRRGVPLTMDNQEDSIARAARGLSPLIHQHQVVISHGNGPQVGLLALQADAYDHENSYPFDVLGAQTEGMIGYLLERELRNDLGAARTVATVVTMTEVDLKDPAFSDPSKFDGPIYTEAEAHRLAAKNGWTVKPDGHYWRRVVASPQPMKILELTPVEWLLDRGAVVICAGGGGIPTARDPLSRRWLGVEAVIDKDRTSAVLARGLRADMLIIATDVVGVFDRWGTAEQRLIAEANPDDLDQSAFAAGSMGPKVAAAVDFARSGHGRAVIGSLDDITALVEHRAGTLIAAHCSGVTYRETTPAA